MLPGSPDTQVPNARPSPTPPTTTARGLGSAAQPRPRAFVVKGATGLVSDPGGDRDGEGGLTIRALSGEVKYLGQVIRRQSTSLRFSSGHAPFRGCPRRTTFL